MTLATEDGSVTDKELSTFFCTVVMGIYDEVFSL